MAKEKDLPEAEVKAQDPLDHDGDGVKGGVKDPSPLTEEEKAQLEEEASVEEVEEPEAPIDEESEGPDDEEDFEFVDREYPPAHHGTTNAANIGLQTDASGSFEAVGHAKSDKSGTRI